MYYDILSETYHEVKEPLSMPSERHKFNDK